LHLKLKGAAPQSQLQKQPYRKKKNTIFIDKAETICLYALAMENPSLPKTVEVLKTAISRGAFRVYVSMRGFGTAVCSTPAFPAKGGDWYGSDNKRVSPFEVERMLSSPLATVQLQNDNGWDLL
jgi:hypothetical protein